MKHTPGPWHVDDRHPDDPYIWYVRPKVRDNFYYPDIVTTYHNGDEEVRANTLLIVASPELYSSLDSLVKRIREEDDAWKYEATLTVCESVLKKARGES